MNKEEFISALRGKLYRLSEEDIKRSIDYYSEIIEDRIEDGLSEEEAVEAVGSVEEIAVQILSETPALEPAKAKIKPRRTLKAWEIILLVLGSPVWVPLFIAALSIALAVYIVLWSLILVLYSVDISFAAGAIAGVFGAFGYIFAGSLAQGVLFFGTGLVCAGITILLFFGFNRITKGVLILSKKVLSGIRSCFVGKEEAR